MQENTPKMPGASAFKSKGNFQISIGAETFRIFSSGLYSNPVKAIIREYSTNAKDSQVEAGVDRPFEVQLPTLRNPMFKIRDYGTGMSPERIETVYQTYGASTKRDTNQSTGKFGLGSKSALSYVNSFAVMSYYNGIVHKYLVVLNDDSIPELLTDGEPYATDEPNGVKIQFAVDTNDVDAFTKAAQEVYAYFEIPPKFVGDNVPAIKYPQYCMEGEETDFKWKIKVGEKYSHGTSQIIMGSNCYPLGEELYSYSNSGIDYFVEIDAFEPTPSRESLNWGNQDIKRFKEMVNTLKKSLFKRFKDEVKGMTTFQELHVFGKYRHSIIGDVVRELDDSPKYRYSHYHFNSACLQESTNFKIDANYSSVRFLGLASVLRVIKSAQRGSGHKLMRLHDITPQELISEGYSGVPIRDFIDDWNSVKGIINWYANPFIWSIYLEKLD